MSCFVSLPDVNAPIDFSKSKFAVFYRDCKPLEILEFTAHGKTLIRWHLNDESRVTLDDRTRRLSIRIPTPHEVW